MPRIAPSTALMLTLELGPCVAASPDDFGEVGERNCAGTTMAFGFPVPGHQLDLNGKGDQGDHRQGLRGDRHAGRAG